MSLRYGDTKDALDNRRVFLKGLGIDSSTLVCAEQTHSSNVWYARQEDIGKGALDHQEAIPDTDALITDKKKLPLAVFTADCLSVFLFDPHRPAVGIIHAGWRSTQANITIKAIRLMCREFNTKPQDLRASFGPAIGPSCFEVEDKFCQFFPGKIIRKDNRLFLDLPRINKDELLESGVKEENIFDPGVCTVCRNEDFFSYRQEKESAGRMISVIMLL